MDNPKFKKGDRGILKSSPSLYLYIGQHFIIHNVSHVNSQNVSYSISFDGSNQKWTLYEAQDSFTRETREEMIKDLEEKLISLEIEKKTISQELEFLTKYESEEDFVAHKLEEVLNTSKKGSKIERVKAITEILQTMKKSNLI